MSQVALISGWDNNDLRKKFSLYNNYLINGVLTAAEVEPGIYDMRMGKYKDPNAPIDTGNGNDFYFYRYADVLLIFAEAENKLNGPTADAYNAINQVRRRGFGVNIGTPSAAADLPAHRQCPCGWPAAASESGQAGLHTGSGRCLPARWLR